MFSGDALAVGGEGAQQLTTSAHNRAAQRESPQLLWKGDPLQHSPPGCENSGYAC
jgi:hypothetical protein